jgi:aldehyde dehydrogenase (NAD(P)+)
LAALPARDRARLLRSVLSRFHELSDRIVELDCRAKDIPRDSQRAGEPMFDGPAIVLRYASELALTLEGKSAVGPESVRNEGGRTIVDLLPRNAYERLLFPFWRGEARLDREVAWDAVQTPSHELTSDRGTVALVLGAGNVTSIGVVDALQQCFSHGRACLYKVSPVNDYLGPLLELAFAPLVKEGWFEFAYGGRDVGERLVADPAIDAVHVTGALETFESIVWGPKEGRAERKARGEPVLKKPVTAELGNVSPVVVVPGDYDERELEHAARSIVGAFTFNAAFNCNATKLVVTAHGWPQRGALLARIRHHFERVSPRLAYYPGAEEKYRRFSQAGGRLHSFGEASDGALPWAFVTDLDAGKDEEVFRDEPFCAVLSEVALPGSDALEFLPEATLFLNDRVWGTLNAMLIAPKSVEDDRATAAALEQAISALRYGSVCVNLWPAAAYGLGTPPWGGHPSGTLTDVQSGLGWGHNALLLRHVEKTVLYAPLVQIPKPLWYPDHRTLAPLAREFADFSAGPSPWKLARLAATALRG